MQKSRFKSAGMSQRALLVRAHACTHAALNLLDQLEHKMIACRRLCCSSAQRAGRRALNLFVAKIEV